MPVMGSALSKPLQSSGTAPRAPRDRDHPGASPEEVGCHGGMLWASTLWVLGGRTQLSLSGTVAQALPAPRRQSPLAPGSLILWQPWWAGVRLPPALCQHRDTNTAVHLIVPMKGPRNVTVVLTQNLKHGTGMCQGGWGAADWRGYRPPAQPTLPAPGSSGLSAAALGLCLLNSPGPKHCPSGCQLIAILFCVGGKSNTPGTPAGATGEGSWDRLTAVQVVVHR